MLKNLAIATLVVCVALLAAVVVRLENFHYASVVGMCQQYRADDPAQNAKRHQCLHEASTRTHPVWHLFYAVTDWH
jgi:hypothetical protein